MYKKIKNGSFMNWIWFIICLMPLLLILIFAIGNYNKIITTKIDNLLNFNSNYVSNEDFDYYFENNKVSSSLLEYIITTNDFSINSENNIVLINNSLSDGTDTYIFYFENYIYNNDYFYFKLVGNTTSIEYSFNYKENNVSKTDSIELNTIYKYNLNGEMELDLLGEIVNSNFEEFNLNLYIFISKNDYNIDLLSDNWNYIEIENDITFNNYLNNINNTLKTNGFISSAFLNLATLFGVNNVYYSLACYYIEYLLIIILLHLGFDLLYIVPNICHKFMEKIGGERD